MKYEISTRTEMLVQIFVKKNKKTIKRENKKKNIEKCQK